MTTISNKEIYVFSGLGADERMFQKIDFSGYRVTFLKWIIPQNRETIEHYCSRMLEQIPKNRPVTLIGLSFGGMMAMEAAKQIQTEQIILISSSKTQQEIPLLFRIAGKLKINRLLPWKFLKSSNPAVEWFFGGKTTETKQLLKQILAETDPQYLSWAVERILTWQNQIVPENTFHIHGTRDKVLPIKFIKCDVQVQRGRHLMVFDRAEEVSKIILKRLER